MDYESLKSIMTWLSAPLTFILGLAGWHYKNIYTKVEQLDDTTSRLQVMVGEHSVHVNHLNNSVNKIETKIDEILKKLESK